MGAADNLSSLLWRERELLDLLIFKLETEQLLLTAGKTKWLLHATREVESVVLRLRETGLARAVAASAVALEWGVSDELPLGSLAAAAPASGPWGDLLRSHLEAMTGQTGQIKQLRYENEQHLRAAARSAQETVSTLMPDAGIYDARGAATPVGAGTGGGLIFDKDL